MNKKEGCPCLSKDFSNSEDDFAVFTEDTEILMICEQGKIRVIKCGEEDGRERTK